MLLTSQHSKWPLFGPVSSSPSHPHPSIKALVQGLSHAKNLCQSLSSLLFDSVSSHLKRCSLSLLLFISPLYSNQNSSIDALTSLLPWFTFPSALIPLTCRFILPLKTCYEKTKSSALYLHKLRFLFSRLFLITRKLLHNTERLTSLFLLNLLKLCQWTDISKGQHGSLAHDICQNMRAHFCVPNT